MRKVKLPSILLQLFIVSLVTEITLISTSNTHLHNCKRDIVQLAQLASFTKQLTQKSDMLDWSQATINQFYTFCLERDVKPKLDLDALTIELVGPKDAVNDQWQH
jgi:hypothetical protein